jgi:hypothetical protein
VGQLAVPWAFVALALPVGTGVTAALDDAGFEPDPQPIAAISPAVITAAAAALVRSIESSLDTPLGRSGIAA